MTVDPAQLRAFAERCTAVRCKGLLDRRHGWSVTFSNDRRPMVLEERGPGSSGSLGHAP